jgi:hypothetical protein
VTFVFLCLLTSKYPAEQDEECEARICEYETGEEKQATPKVAFVFLCLLTSKYPAEQDEECEARNNVYSKHGGNRKDRSCRNVEGGVPI